MSSYRLARRNFIAGLGGAFGLKIMLRNLEAMAQGAVSPPRFLMMHFPVGTQAYHFLPTGSGTNFTFSRILKPFEPLKAETIILYGLNDRPGVTCGGGHEAGTPLTTTGAAVPGCRANNGEADDGVAGGPSLDQIFLKNVANLQRPGVGYINTICDARVDSQETSTQCLSYSYTMRMVQNTSGGQVNEATPLLPTLKPIDAYNALFSGFVPGTPDGGTGGADAGVNMALLKALKERKSVLDFAMRELARIKTLSPGDQAPKIEIHTDAIRKMELQITDQINAMGDAGTGGGGSVACTKPGSPDPALSGKTGSKNDYGNTTTTIADDAIHEQIGKAHAAIIRAAFQCDIIRVATHQWSPGTNHVSFAGLHMDGKTHMHHPESHKVQQVGFWNGSPPTDATQLGIFDFCASVSTWYNQKTADIITDFKNSTDSFGGNLLDNTVIPYITEVSEANHSRFPKPALIFGGRKLGMQGGQFLQFTGNGRPHNDLWMTIAQAYFGMVPAFATIAPTFVTSGVAAIPGLWVKPP